MKRFIPLLSLLSSCTLHQQERVAEMLTPTPKSEELRNLHLVNEALADNSEPIFLTLEEIACPDLPCQVFALQAMGIPAGERYLFATRDPLKNRIQIHFEFEVLNDNSLYLFEADSAKIVEGAPVALQNLLKGQEIEMLLVSKKKRSCTRAKFLPSPQIFSDETRVFFALQPTHRRATHFLLHGHGLKPFETIRVTETSGSQVREHLLEADENGDLAMRVEPLVPGKLGGEASLSILRETQAEMAIAYKWGGLYEQESRRNTPVLPLLFVANRNAAQIDLLALLKPDKNLPLPIQALYKQAASQA